MWSWDRSPKQGRWTKVPRQLDGRNASSTNPATWAAFADALAAYRGTSDSAGGTGERSFAGLGFFLGDGWSGVDVDGCFHQGSMTALGRSLLERFPTYAERSPTGTGYKLFFRADLTSALDALGLKTGGKNTVLDVEIYTRGRFFTVTSEVLAGEAVADCQAEGERLVTELLAPDIEPAAPKPESRRATAGTHVPPAGCDVLRLMLENPKNGSKIRALYDGEASAYKSQSDADLALCCHLAFWFDKDAGRIESVFNQSKLGERKKWTTRPEYRSRTIAKAIASTKDTYQPRARPTVGSAYRADAATAPAGSTLEDAAHEVCIPKPEEGEQWNDPFRLARLLVDASRTPEGHPTIVQWCDEYHAWETAWRPVPDSDLDARIARHCREVFVADMPARKAAAEAASDGKKELKPPTIFPVTGKTKGDVRVNLSGLVNHPDSGIDAPFWLWGDESQRVTEVVAAPNGLFTIGDIAAGRGPFEPPTPRLFTFNALPFTVPAEEQSEPTLWM
ncbi:hypothetical protein J8F10_31885 [Gemmata sp. G18]|uniref:NrS-1 polymerase-like HBD domain-containing protein n=1 Tax=Gemmata palustris TaxID=2822762 RepID=A0ABS5C1K4_9BACT|nr:hypothetical protein [Gemmata palustris]MBP3959873.1 hypothetical protein [Gemmata palustris]